jgi:hypothetical protein
VPRPNQLRSRPDMCVLSQVDGVLWRTDLWAAPEDGAWSWSGSAVERSALHALGISPQDVQKAEDTAARPSATTPSLSTPMAPQVPPEGARPAAVAADGLLLPTPQPPFASPPANTATDDGGFFAYTPSAVPVQGSTAAPKDPFAAQQPTASSEVDPFGDFASTPAVAPPPPALTPSGSLMDVDLLGGAFSSDMPPAAVNSGSLLNSTMAQMGMADMFASPDSSANSKLGAQSASDAWLAKLPDLSFVLATGLTRPQAVA